MEVLMGQIEGQKNERARLRTLLHGWIAAFTTANRTGVQNSAVKELISAETPMIDDYCNAVFGTGEPQTSGAGTGGR